MLVPWVWLLHVSVNSCLWDTPGDQLTRRSPLDTSVTQPAVTAGRFECWRFSTAAMEHRGLVHLLCVLGVFHEGKRKMTE